MKKLACLVLVLFFFLSLYTMAGNLEPSAPPTSGTMKSLDKVEPRIPIGQSDIPKVIDTPGSYYLTENISNVLGNAISITADDVTLDLAGFSMIGVDFGTYYGISMNGRSNVEIRNGTIRDFTVAIYDISSSAHGHRVLNVRAVSNLSMGIVLNGSGHLVKSCVAYDNGSNASSNVYGIKVESSSTVEGNIANNNGFNANNEVYGIYAGSGSTVKGNTTILNGSRVNTAYGIYAGSGSTVINNTCKENGNSTILYAYGIYAYKGCTVTGNTCSENGKNGDGARIYGIYAYNGCAVIGNTAYSNGSGNTLDESTVYGFYILGDSYVDGNVSYDHKDDNMYIASGCTIGLNHNPAP